MNNTKHSVKTAILIDGGYYRKRARSLFGTKNPKDSADDLEIKPNLFEHIDGIRSPSVNYITSQKNSNEPVT